MQQLEVECRDFSPKTIEVVTTTTCFPPKGIKSVEKTREPVKVTVTERSSSSSSYFPPRKKMTRQFAFTEFGLSPIFTTSPPLSVVIPSSELNLSPRSPFSSTCKSDSPIPIPRGNTKAKNGTPKGPKKCGCKQSKCLKLYCECFASGEYCNGCSCADCCNTVENEDLRKVAAQIILERNPHAFKPKIATSPYSPQDFRGDDSPRVVRHEKGCHCKKSECLKKYCECFEADVFCSENCKCVDCKNFEVRKEMMAASDKDDSWSKICRNSEGCEKIAISLRDNSSREIYQSFKGPERLMAVASEDSTDSKVYIQKVTAAKSNINGLSGQSFSQELRKRKHQELHLNDKDSLIQSFSDFQKVNNLNDSSPSASLSVEPNSHINISDMMGSFRHPYSRRLMLADVLYLQDTKKVSSGLALLAEAAALAQVAKIFADKEEVKDAEEKKNQDTLGGEEIDYKGGPAHVQKRVPNDLGPGCGATDAQEGRTLPPETAPVIYIEKHKQFMGTSLYQILNCNHKNSYAEQEMSILSSFRDFLEELIITNIKGTTQFSSGIHYSISNADNRN